MSQPGEIGTTLSGGRLGGISTMVTQADVCPSCGGRHGEGRRSFWDRSRRVEPPCPVVHGPFPVLMQLPESTEIIVEFPFVSEPSPPEGASKAPESEPPVLARRLGQLPVPWPAPSFDEAYL